MFGEDFLGLRELGIASELGVSSLSVPKKLLRPKGARMGAGSSLPYVEPLLVFYPLAYSSMTPLRTEANRWNLRHPSHHHPHSSHSSRRGWKTKSLDSCDPSSSLVSIPSHNLRPLLPNPYLPRIVPQRPKALRHFNKYHPSWGSCCSHLHHFQHYRNRLCSNLHSLNRHQYSSSRTTSQAWPKQRWDPSGRSPAGNRRTLPRRRKRRRRKTPRCLGLVVLAAAASLVS